MNRKIFSVGIVAILVAIFLSVLYVQPAQACEYCCGNCLPIEALTCNSITFSLPGASEMDYKINGYDIYRNDIYFAQELIPNAGPATVSFSIPSGDYLSIEVYDPVNRVFGSTYDIVIPGCVTNGVTWFTPGDARVSGHPGDQIAVYCNKATATSAANIDVWGIINSDGFSLTKVNVSDIAQSGAGYKDGKDGTVILGGSGGYFFAAWFNGAYGANGQNSFTKTFSCTF